MADRVFTRLQWEVSHHQKKLERIETKMDESVNRLRQDMEKISADVKLMFDQIMLKMEGCNTRKVVVELPEDVEKSKGVLVLRRLSPCDLMLLVINWLNGGRLANKVALNVQGLIDLIFLDGFWNGILRLAKLKKQIRFAPS